jgi:hypothetical protein
MPKVFLSIALLLFLGGFAVQAQQSRVQQANRQEAVPQMDIKYYPNPVVDQLIIEAGEGQTAEGLTLRVVNLIGSEMKLDLDRSEPGKVKLNVNDFPTGYYMVSVRDDKNRQSQTFRILKK